MTKGIVKKMLVTAFAGAGLFTSCQKNDTGFVHSGDFNLVYGIGYRGASEILMLPTDNKASEVIDFKGKGYKFNSEVRTNRFYSSNDSKYIYNYEYGVGAVTRLTRSNDSEIYKEEKRIDLKGIIGTTYARWKMIDENTALLYDVKVNHLKNTDNSYKETRSTLHIVKISLPSLTVGEKMEIELPKEEDETSTLPNLHIWRIDNPIVANGKVYFGVAKRGFDGAKNVGGQEYGASEEHAYYTSTLLLDYPSLNNPKIIKTTMGKGQNYGYRTPSFFQTENSDVFNIGMDNGRIYRFRANNYDANYDFDLAKALNLNKIGATGMFYTHSGIAYVIFYDAEKGNGVQQAAWGVARVDLNTRTAIKMELPENLWLNYYQNAKYANGKLYMAICPTKSAGNIYAFDPTKASATGYEKGATINVSGEGYYLGIW